MEEILEEMHLSDSCGLTQLDLKKAGFESQFSATGFCSLLLIAMSVTSIFQCTKNITSGLGKDGLNFLQLTGYILNINTEIRIETHIILFGIKKIFHTWKIK